MFNVHARENELGHTHKTKTTMKGTLCGVKRSTVQSSVNDVSYRMLATFLDRCKVDTPKL